MPVKNEAIKKANYKVRKSFTIFPFDFEYKSDWNNTRNKEGSKRWPLSTFASPSQGSLDPTSYTPALRVAGVITLLPSPSLPTPNLSRFCILPLAVSRSLADVPSLAYLSFSAVSRLRVLSRARTLYPVRFPRPCGSTTPLTNASHNRTAQYRHLCKDSLPFSQFLPGQRFTRGWLDQRSR